MRRGFIGQPGIYGEKYFSSELNLPRMGGRGDDGPLVLFV